jgi:hypothetical protein
MQTEMKWMPVFTVIEARKTVHAAHPDSKHKVVGDKETNAQNFEQRIGTANVQPDGSFVVQLTAFPISGRLLIRKPRAGEHEDPTSKE